LIYSKQVEERPSKALSNSHGFTSKYGDCNKCQAGIVNNGEDGKFCLKHRLEQSLNQTNNNHSQEIERQYLQEIPPKQECKIM